MKTTNPARTVVRRNQLIDGVATALLWVIACFLVFLLLILLGYIFINGLPHVSWSFLTGRPSQSSAGGGIGPEIFNSFYILFLSLIVSLPIGLGTAIWLAEYAKPGKLTDLVRLSAESLASVPSIVFGMFGMLLFVQLAHFSFSILSGSLALSLLNLPVLVRVFEESIQQVPRSFREASLALGANKWQTIWFVVLLSALPSLITGVTLVAGRALGETAILILTAGSSVSRHVPDFSLDASGGTLSVQLYYAMTTAIVPDAKQIAQGSAAVLVLIVLLFNLVVGIPAKILQKRLTGGQ